MTEASDRDALRRAALRVGLRIAAVCALLVVLVVAAAWLYLLQQAGQPAPSGAAMNGDQRIVIDADDVLQGMLLAGAGGIAVAGVAGWLSARSAIRPLTAALAIQRRFVQDASHELRTPLAVLDTRIQLAQRLPPTGQQLETLLGQLRRDTAALTGIVEELLVTATTGPAQQGASDASSVARAVLSDVELLAQQSGVALRMEAPAPAPVRLPEQPLRRALLALLENALRHTRTGGTVTVAVRTSTTSVQLDVSDTGSGIRGIAPERVFDRFAHAPTAAGQPEGFGIGLALVQEICTSVGGSITVASTGPQGTTFRMILPRAAASS
jgi:two-component system OmpR family sensor kinase